MMEERKFFQSCGMELASKEVCGTNKDNSINEEYCVYCLYDGAFVDDCTMDDMIEVSVKHIWVNQVC